MQPKAQDYYDMPIDLLPSANFAGRPLSDISMLDGLWTMIMSSSSSSSDDDEEEGPTTPVRNPPQAAERPPTGPDKRPKSLSNDVKILERPRLRKKPNTAPSGIISSIDIPTPQLGRATSARIGNSDTAEEKTPQLGRRDGDGKRIVKRTLSNAKFPAPQRPLPPVLGPRYADSGFGIREVSSFPGSLSQKLRVQKTLKRKQIGVLETDLAAYDSKRAPYSANSMLTTPRELYAIPEQQATHEAESDAQVLDAQPEVGSSRRRRKRSSTRSMSPKTASPAAQSLMEARGRVCGTNDIKAEDSSESLRPQRIYVPGAIRVEEHSAMPRRDSVATLDPFDRPQHKAHRFSDMIVEDATWVFFDELGVVEDVTEASLDRFWLDGRRGYTDSDVQDAAWRRPSISSATETRPTSPPRAHSLHRSSFSFSSTSSRTWSPPVGKTPRTMFGRLLSPALPGAAFLRAPAIFEKQAKKWQGRNDGGWTRW